MFKRKYYYKIQLTGSSITINARLNTQREVARTLWSCEGVYTIWSWRAKTTMELLYRIMKQENVYLVYDGVLQYEIKRIPTKEKQSEYYH